MATKNIITININERGSITPDMALKLSRAFDTTPDLWNAENLSKEWKNIKPVPLDLIHSKRKVNSEKII